MSKCESHWVDYQKHELFIIWKSKTLSKLNISCLSESTMRHRLAAYSSSFSKDDEFVSSHVWPSLPSWSLSSKKGNLSYMTKFIAFISSDLLGAFSLLEVFIEGVSSWPFSLYEQSSHPCGKKSQFFFIPLRKLIITILNIKICYWV